MPIPTIFFPSFLIWGSHSHFIEIKYTTRKPLEGTLFTLVHLLALRLTITTHFIYVFPSLVNDTHILGLALDVIPVFLWLQEELSALNLSMQSAKCVVWSPSRLDHFISLYLSFFIPDSGFYILNALVGSTSFVESFVVEAFCDYRETISNFLRRLSWCFCYVTLNPWATWFI